MPPTLLQQKTKYPWDGIVALTVTPDAPATFDVLLRIPGWCRGARLKVNGRAAAVKIERGYIRIVRCWAAGDLVELMMPMPVERVEAHPHVRQDAGHIALQRGPVVYCLEGVDNGHDLSDVILPRSAKLTTKFEPALLGGVVVIKGKAQRRDLAEWAGKLYRPVRPALRSVAIKAIPYAAWANRAPGEMVVWILDK